GPPGIVSLHCENWGIVRVLEERLKKQGRMDIGAWDDRSPHFAEAAHVRQFAYFAGLLKCPLYIQHCTCDETMDEVERARKDGLTVYAQTAPCYLSLAKDAWKLNVPLRSKETIERIWKGLREGRIHCVGTDHVNHGVPRAEMEVKGDVWKSVSGFSSRVEAYLQVMLSLGVNQGRISLERVVKQKQCHGDGRRSGRPLCSEKARQPISVQLSSRVPGSKFNVRVLPRPLREREGVRAYATDIARLCANTICLLCHFMPRSRRAFAH